MDSLYSSQITAGVLAGHLSPPPPPNAYHTAPDFSLAKVIQYWLAQSRYNNKMPMNPPREEKKEKKTQTMQYTHSVDPVASPRSSATPSPEEPRPLYILPSPSCITTYHPGPVAAGAGLRVSRPLPGPAEACLLACFAWLLA
jgi:hypothetical protein